MARTSWVGKAQAVAEVIEATIPSISAGQRIGLTISNKTVSYVAVDGDTVKTAAAGLASAWNASDEPEIAEMTAAANGDKVKLTGDVAGVPHTVTSDSTGGTGAEITITRLQGAASAVNQKQFVELPGSPTGGTWKLGFYLNSSSSTIAYNATAATVQTHLEGLAEVGAGNVSVSGDAGGPYTIEFQGDLAGKAMEPLQVDAGGLTLSASDVTATVDVNTDQLEGVMAWEVDRPDNGWTLKQGSLETWILSSDATTDEIAQAVRTSLNIGSVRVDNATNASGTDVIRIYRQGEQARIEPDVALQLVTFTDDAGTAGRTESTATVYQDPDDTLNNYVATVRFRPRLKVMGKAKVNGATGDFNEELTILGADNEVDATSGSGIISAVAQAIRNTGTNEVQEIDAGGATGGVFTLTFDGQTTGNISWDATASQVEQAVEALSNVGDVAGTGGPLNSANVSIEFRGTLASTDVPQMTMDASGLTGATSPGVTTTTTGAPGNVTGTVTAAYVGEGADTYKDIQVTVTSPNTEEYGSPLQLEFEISSVTGLPFWADITQTAVAGKDEVHKITIENATGGTYTLTGDFGSGNEMTSAIDYDATAAAVELAIAGRNEVQEVEISGATGGTFTLTFDGQTTAGIAYNATAADVESALEALSNIDDVDCTGGPMNTAAVAVEFRGTNSDTDVAQMTIDTSGLTGTITSSVTTTVTAVAGLTSVRDADLEVYGNAGGPYTLVWGGAYDNTAVDLLTATSSLTNSPAVTLSVSTVVDATGPNHFDAAKNWSGGAVPSTGDTLVFRDTSIPLLYGLSQSGITPAGIEFHASFTGTVGLPDTNANEYPEYRDTKLRIGEAADAQTIAISVRGGSNRIRLDTGDCPATIQITDTGISDTNEPAAFRWTGTAATNTVVYLAGSVFLGDEAGATAAINTLRVASRNGGYGELELASGLTVTTTQHTGGEVTSRATLTTANIGGTWIQDGATVGTLTTLPNGSVRVLGSPTITTLDVGSDGSIDFGGANAPTATTTRLSAGAELLDPQGSVTFTNGIELVLCGLSDVSLDVGQGKTLTIS